MNWTRPAVRHIIQDVYRCVYSNFNIIPTEACKVPCRWWGRYVVCQAFVDMEALNLWSTSGQILPETVSITFAIQDHVIPSKTTIRESKVWTIIRRQLSLLLPATGNNSTCDFWVLVFTGTDYKRRYDAVAFEFQLLKQNVSYHKYHVGVLESVQYRTFLRSNNNDQPDSQQTRTFYIWKSFLLIHVAIPDNQNFQNEHGELTGIN